MVFSRSRPVSQLNKLSNVSVLTDYFNNKQHNKTGSQTTLINLDRFRSTSVSKVIDKTIGNKDGVSFKVQFN